jgi:hypothetical protein
MERHALRNRASLAQGPSPLPIYHTPHYIFTTRTQVVDKVLKDDTANDQELYHRAGGLLFLGAIFESTVPGESEEERRELERCVHLPPHPSC